MTPTLDRERADQVRTFLVTEAAASVASPRRGTGTTMRRTVVAGSLAAALVAGGVALSRTGDTVGPGSRPGPAAPTTSAAVTLPDLQAIAVATEGGWSTVRLVDLDAEPDAVVADLRAAGFTADLSPATVTPDGRATIVADGAVMALVEDPGSTPVGSGGVVGIAVRLPDDVTLGAERADAGRTIVVDGEPTVRFGADGSISIRRGRPITVLVIAV